MFCGLFFEAPPNIIFIIMKFFNLIYLLSFTLAVDFTNKTITIDSISMDTSWDQIGDHHRSLILKTAEEEYCLEVDFYSQDKKMFYVNYLKGGGLCPSGKRIMNELISHTDVQGYKIGALLDDSQFHVTKNKDESRLLSSRILNAIDWGFDCGDYAYSYYNQFGFQYSPEDNKLLKEAENYFKQVKLETFKRRLSGYTKERWEVLTRKYKLDKEILLKDFFMELKKDNANEYSQLIYETFYLADHMTKDNQRFLLILGSLYDMTRDIDNLKQIDCKKIF